MVYYLTNTALANEARCIHAAKVSGMDVRFERLPMPIQDNDWLDLDLDCYNPAAFVGSYGCVVSHAGCVDHGPFWDAWDAYSPTPADDGE